MKMQLTHITLRGLMQGPIYWPAGEICETEFNRDFAAPGAPHSPWKTDWVSLDEALQEVLSCGDFMGGMGELVGGQIVFHVAGNGRSISIAKPLDEMHAAKPYLAEELI